MSATRRAGAPNRLAETKSPYLLQHQHNPVNWQPWDTAALAQAREEDKPIFLSIGYATCHWCHVMEHESFADPEVAALMNARFINIKVDREERPDLDRVYMAYVQAVSGSGGWPMSVWLTPALEPFFGGTYFPPQGRHGRPAFSSVLRELGQAWQQQRERVVTTASNALRSLREVLESQSHGEGPGATAPLVEGAYQQLARSYDPRWGGFGSAPKFPRPVSLDFLLQRFARHGVERAAEMALETLRQMGRGGIYDHVGGGFHRYSVDGAWHVPHFEKMLYDQAQLVSVLADAYRLTGDTELAAKAKETLHYVLSELRDPEGGAFYSAEDADSLPDAGANQKREGAFYVWTAAELNEVLGADAELFFTHFGIEDEGNADDPHGELTGTNVLHETGPLSATAAQLGITVDEADERLSHGLAELARVRGQRPRPLLDDKVLCAWNGLMICAAAKAGMAFEEPRYIEAAAGAARFVMATLWDSEKRTLYRRYREGEASIEGYLEDYAFMVEGLIELYQATFDPRWLDHALLLHERQDDLFWDREGGGYFVSSGHDPSVLLRLKDDHDGAEPSGNAVAAHNGWRLGALLGRADWSRRAEETLAHYGERLAAAPLAMPRLLSVSELVAEIPRTLIFSAGQDGLDPLVHTWRAAYCPDLVALRADPQTVQRYGDALPQLSAIAEDPQAAAHLCRRGACELPARDTATLEAQLGARRLGDRC